MYVKHNNIVVFDVHTHLPIYLTASEYILCLLTYLLLNSMRAVTDKLPVTLGQYRYCKIIWHMSGHMGARLKDSHCKYLFVFVSLQSSAIINLILELNWATRKWWERHFWVGEIYLTIFSEKVKFCYTFNLPREGDSWYIWGHYKLCKYNYWIVKLHIFVTVFKLLKLKPVTILTLPKGEWHSFFLHRLLVSPGFSDAPELWVPDAELHRADPDLTEPAPVFVSLLPK